MFIYCRQSYGLPKTFAIFNRSPSLTLFSAFSSISGSLRSNTNKPIYRQLVRLKTRHPQPRHFSQQNVQSFYDSVSSSGICKFITQILIDTHDLTGLSWSSTIIASSVIVRLFVNLPCGIYQQYLLSKLELIKAELRTIAKGLKDEVMLEAIKRKWTKKECISALQQNVGQQWNTLIVKNNCHPFKIPVLFIAQVPAWLLMTLAIKKITVDAATGKLDSPVDAILLQVGGPFWSKNLIKPDPIFILPIINFVCFFAQLEMSFLTPTPNFVKKSFKFYFSIVHKYFLRIIGVAFLFICAAQPSAVSLYWASNSLLNLIQKLLILSPRARRFFKIPKSPFEIEKPYSHMKNMFSEKITGLFFRK